MAAKLRHKRLYLSAKMALTSTTVMAVCASGLLIYSFYQRDYNILYVMKNSSNDLPALYTLTAFWSSLEGSHTLWTLLLSIVSCVAVWTHSKDNEHIMPYVSAALQLVLAWMFYLTVTHSDPFVLNLPAPANGRGMNELLQNFYMAIHPPMLFLGYVGLAVPFAYSIAALMYGDITEGWTKTVRRWAIFSWILLTAAITLGGRWAYVELGWAGYWAWDPVENSSFMPWLMCTALLHSLIVQEKLGQLKRLTIVLSILGFFMSYFGTFITRSGVISSVHAFAESPIGPNYLMFLAGLMLLSTFLYALRAPSILPMDADKVWGVSKESSLVAALFLLISFAVIVFIGTMFPIFSEAVTSQRISVQAPYFNAFAPYIGLGFIVLMAVGNLMRYQSDDVSFLKKTAVISLFISIPFTALFIYFGDVMRTVQMKYLIAQLIGIYLCFWSMSCLSVDFYDRLKRLQFKYRLFFNRNLAYTGAYVAHIGLLVAILGFLGNYRGLEKKVSLNVGDKTELYGYSFEFYSGIQVKKDENATLYEAPLGVFKDGKKLSNLYPAQSTYPTKRGQTFNEIGVLGSLWNDVYIVLVDFDKSSGKRVTLKININPTVRVVWIAIVLMCLGGLIALFDVRRGNQSKDVIAGKWQLKK